MQDMIDAVDASDSQWIRSSLTRLRKGEVPDPSTRGGRLRPLAVRYNTSDRHYHDLANTTGEAVAAQIPGSILSGALGDMLTRISTLNTSMGQEGLVRASGMLKDEEVRQLIEQIPVTEVWRLQDQLQEVARARELLSGSGEGGRLPPSRS